MNFTLKIWRQKDAQSKGQFKTYQISDISADSSFLEMIDELNEHLVKKGEDPVHFDHDCREGICGTCSTSPCLHCDAANQGFAHENLFSLSGRNEFPQGKRVVLARTSLHQVEGTALILKSAMDLDGQTLLAPMGPPNWSISESALLL